MCSRSVRTRCLWSFILTITTVACVTLLYVYLEIQAKYPSHSNGVSVQEKLSKEECVPVCDSKECLIFAKFLLSNMKPDADPCENIHTFACGTYTDRYISEEGRSTHLDTFHKIFDVLNDIIRDIKAEPESASGKLKIMYDSCMDYVSMEKYALPTAQKFLNDIGIADWPHIDENFRFINTDIPTILGRMKGRGELIFLMPIAHTRKISDAYPPLNETHDIYIQADLRYLGNLLTLHKKSSAVDILKFFALEKHSIEEIWCNYETVRESMISLSNEACWPIKYQVECLDDSKFKQEESCSHFRSACNPLMYNEDNWIRQTEHLSCEANLTCSKLYDDPTHLCKFLEVFLNNSNVGENYRLNPDFITVNYKEFVMNVIPLLKNFTDKEVADFLALNYYLNHLGELNFHFQKTKHKYFSLKRCELFKGPASFDRWRVCTDWVVENMHFVSQYEFLKNYLTLEENKKILNMYDECKSELEAALSRQTWMEEKDKKTINVNGTTINLELLKEIQSRSLEYEQSVNGYYKSFHPTGENFFQDAMELRRTTSEIHLMLAPIDHFLLSMKFMKNAYYEDCQNHIVYHFGQFIPMHYMPGLPRLINLLLFAVYGAHELAHDIDLNIEYEIKGSLDEKWVEREHCLENQFSQFKYQFEDKHLDGSQFTIENVADNIFTFVIDKLIEKYTSAHEEILLPGFNYSFKQIVYIFVNELFCSKTSDDEEWLFRTGDTHSPHMLRSIGPMQNSKAFSAAFNCSEGSYMNPTPKCAMLDDI